MATIFEDSHMSFALHHDTLVLNWKDTTAKMTAEQFRLSLAGYAADALANRVSKLLVDARHFRFGDVMSIENWRQRAVIPLYNAAGVKRMAYLLPANLPDLPPGREPDDNEQFATGYFNSEDEAHTWLNAGS